MLNTPIFDIKGNKKGNIKLSEEIFAVKSNPQLVAQSIRVYLANQRQATPQAKTRGQVSGSRRKIWRQKGTGRARHGDRYAPIFVGGGVAHGPKGIRRKLKISKNIKQKAFFVTLSEKVRNNQVFVIDGLEKLEPKTKIIKKNLDWLFIKNIRPKDKVLLIITQEAINLKRGARNIRNLNILSLNSLNTYQVMNSDYLIITQAAIENLENNLLAKTKTEVSEKTKVSKKSSSLKKTPTLRKPKARKSVRSRRKK